MTGASFGAGSLVTGMRRFDRILDIDHEMNWVRAEAGISLGKLYGFLAARGLHIPVQPGHPDITLGGCIAANVHGKNQFREGDFAGLVREIELFHPSRGTIRLTPRENAALFDLTCGGYGLTGVIVSAAIGVAKFPGGQAQISNIPTIGLLATVEKLLEMRDSHDFLYSWSDMGGVGQSKGFVRAGNFLNDAAVGTAPLHHRPLDPMRSVPAINLYNRAILPPLNALYAAFNRHVRTIQTIDALDVFFPFASMPFYFHAYGKAGYLEHQVLIPDDAIASYLGEFDRLHAKFRIPLGLATFKLFDGARQLLRFSGKGISFAFHAPRGARLDEFMSEVDRLDIDHGAIANLIKDARVTSDVAAAQYPEIDSVRERLAAHDPDRMFASLLSRRLDL